MFSRNEYRFYKNDPGGIGLTIIPNRKFLYACINDMAILNISGMVGLR